MTKAFRQSVPSRLCEAIDIGTLSSPRGYGAGLSSNLAKKYGPYIVAPASVENFFYAGERQKSDTFSTYIAAKELALQELESNIGEKFTIKRLQVESFLGTLACYQAMMTFDQAAAALRPLD